MSSIHMAEDQTIFQGCGHITDSPGAESPASVPPQDTLMENSECDQETWHVRFRTFSSSEESDPIEDLRRLRELCHLWLRPDLHTKEQMMDRLVLEQFMVCMPLECQVLLKESGVQSCKDLEDVLRNKQKPKKWTIVCIQGQKYLVRDPDTEVVEAKASDMDDDRDPCGEPQPLVRVIPPEDGLEGSQELQNLPGAADLSREPARQWKQGEESQDQRALPPETVPESGEPEGQTPRENLEKDLLEDRGETKTLQSQEPELLKGPDMAKEKGTAVPLAKTCVNKQPRVWTKESFQDSLGPIPLLHLAPWDPPVFLREQKPRDGHPVNAGNPNPKMGSMDTYEQVQKGPLKLKGGPELGVTKRKKKKDRDKAKLLQTMGKIQKNQEEELRRHLDKRTPAQVAFEKVQEKRQMERVLKKASITHKQRVEDFNRHLDTLSEHYDIPKVSWTK
ncbi:hypothetical protein MG293_015882 [Ovis ammon polii]|uniref:Protein FAM32A n=1 Tax=Ovis ammon polii TaxID=230172 RepID=A0AAD4TVG7_OVIAM|nr:hypothetical protein MG293_015882 [Ovis ammon polii]